MTGRRRRELASSFRLLAAEERWLPTDLLLGALALVVWVAGTGTLVTQVASAAGMPLGLGPGETPATLTVGLFAGLWLVVPGAAFVVRVRQRMLNLRGNVEQYYRMEHPAALLVPPLVLVAVVIGAALTLGMVPWYLTLLAVPVGLFALVRTQAYSYRVYGFSHPLLVQGGTFLATVVALGGAFGAIATPTGSGELVQQSLWAVGLSGVLTGELPVGPLAMTWESVAALFPVFVAFSYVVVQTLVALGVRALKPEVDRSKMRTGQRYPPFLETATPVSAGEARGQASTPTSSGSSTSDVHADADGEDERDSSADPDENADDSDEETEDEDLDDVSNTRVFTPPSGDESPEFDSDGADTGADGATSVQSTGTSGDDTETTSQTRAVPSNDAPDTGGTGGDKTDTADREHCVACGESFSVGTTVRFCPNCGAALEGE